MNNERRKRINALVNEVENFTNEVNELHTKVDEAITALNDKVQEMKDNIIGSIEEVRDEEQEYYDNMPESLQGGEKGEMASAAIEHLESAINDLEGLTEMDLPECPDLAEIQSSLEQAGE